MTHSLSVILFDSQKTHLGPFNLGDATIQQMQLQAQRELIKISA